MNPGRPSDGGGLRAAWVRAVSGRLGESLILVGVWSGAPALPPAELTRLVYALPSRRVATLRHWRDEDEWIADIDGTRHHVVAIEASKHARLLLKSHPPTLSCAARPADVDPHGLTDDLPTLARGLWDARALAWCAHAGIDPPAASAASGAGDRHARVEQWLVRVRAAADRALARRRAPGPERTEAS